MNEKLNLNYFLNLCNIDSGNFSRFLNKKDDRMLSITKCFQLKSSIQDFIRIADKIA